MEWTTVGDFAGTTRNQWNYQTTRPRGVACVGDDVFVVGSVDGSWVVRKSSDGGATWPVVDNFRLSSGDDCHAYGIAADSLGNVIVVGTGKQTVTIGKGRNSTTETKTYWVVREGTGGGTSWTTVDQYQYPVAGGTGVAYAVTVAPDNGVHVTGSGASASTSERWVTRHRSAATGLWFRPPPCGRWSSRTRRTGRRCGR